MLETHPFRYGNLIMVAELILLVFHATVSVVIAQELTQALSSQTVEAQVPAIAVSLSGVVLVPDSIAVVSAHNESILPIIFALH